MIASLNPRLQQHLYFGLNINKHNGPGVGAGAG